MSEKLIYTVVTTRALSFLMGSFSFLQVRRTAIKAWMSSSFGQIRLQTAELASLERLKIFIGLQWEKSCEHSSAFMFAWIVFILAGNKEIHKSLNEFKFQFDPTTD